MMFAGANDVRFAHEKEHIASRRPKGATSFADEVGSTSFAHQGKHHFFQLFPNRSVEKIVLILEKNLQFMNKYAIILSKFMKRTEKYSKKDGTIYENR